MLSLHQPFCFLIKNIKLVSILIFFLFFFVTMPDHFDKAMSHEELKAVPTENSEVWDNLVGRQEPSQVFPCAIQALSWATQGREPLVSVADPSATLPEVPVRLQDATHIQVLVTGSLLLVGPVLGILKPGFND